MTSDREKERQRSEEKKKVTKDENGYDSRIRNGL